MLFPLGRVVLYIFVHCICVFSLPKTLVKTLAKNLVKKLAKNLGRIQKPGQKSDKQLFNICLKLLLVSFEVRSAFKKAEKNKLFTAIASRTLSEEETQTLKSNDGLS